MALLIRSQRVTGNRFDYIQPRNYVDVNVHAEPNNLSPLATIQPAVASSRAEKERQRCANQYVQTAVDLQSPPAPMRARRIWTQSQAQSPYYLKTSRSRMQMLSDKAAGRG